MSEKEIQFSKEEIKLMKMLLKEINENDYWNGSFEEFEIYADLPEKEFKEEYKILEGLLKKFGVKKC